MQNQELEQNYHGAVRVELCFACAGIWLDHLASSQLAPGAVIVLFKEIHSHLDAARLPMANRLDCPRCGDALTLGFDISRSGRFSYYRCTRGDGRFTPFLQFLREKQFVRSLSPAEIQRVRSQVRQIRCSECGAPVDLEHASQCAYCHSPVSFLDPEAVEKAMRMWAEAENRRHVAPTPEQLGDALLGVERPRAARAATAPDGRPFTDACGLASSDPGAALDLIVAGIQAIARLL